MKSRRAGWAWVLIGIALIAAACGTQNDADTRRADLAPTIAASSTPLPLPTHDPVMVLATWRDTNALSRAHLLAANEKAPDEKMECASCHRLKSETGEIVFEEPPDEVCLSCHEGSVVKILALKGDDGEPLHEPAHPGAIPCNFCHTGHIETADPCLFCH